ncbi:MAG: hypothetical protein HFH37_07195 [Lachnospiraceae bacterium]|nr:hypothetical protein [Lachnospiraceae bacterium]
MINVAETISQMADRTEKREIWFAPILCMEVSRQRLLNASPEGITLVNENS